MPKAAAVLAIAAVVLGVLALGLDAYGDAEERRVASDCEARDDLFMCGFMAGVGWQYYGFYAGCAAGVLVLAAGLVWFVADRKARRAGPQPS